MEDRAMTTTAAYHAMRITSSHKRIYSYATGRLMASFLAVLTIPSRADGSAALLSFALSHTSIGLVEEKSHPSSRSPLVLVVYYSRSGNTEKMAYAVAEGARNCGGVEVFVRAISEVTAQELSAADAIALGCPTYFANIPGEMKQHLDLWNWKWRVDFTDKIGGAFATGGGQMGGKEHTMVSLLLFMLANRMIVAGPLFEDEAGEDIWGEPGAGAMTGPLDPGISDGELDSARRLGQRLAELAKRFRGSSPPQAFGH